MGIVQTEWRVYFPDEGETADDAERIPAYDWQRISDAEDAARRACEYHFNKRSGWERGEEPFPMTIITPNGEEHMFTAWHEPSVSHRVRAAQ